MPSQTATTPSANPLQPVIDRVREQLVKFGPPEYTAGRDAGKAWAIASPKAHLACFRRLEQLRFNTGASTMARWFDDVYGPGQSSPLDTLLGFLYGQPGVGRDATKAFCAETGLDTDTNAAACAGFLEGILCVWDAIKPLV